MNFNFFDFEDGAKIHSTAGWVSGIAEFQFGGIGVPLGTKAALYGQRGRNATERLLAIHKLISARKFPNRFRMAEEFEVSQKTGKRDVDKMGGRISE